MTYTILDDVTETTPLIYLGPEGNPNGVIPSDTGTILVAPDGVYIKTVGDAEYGWSLIPDDQDAAYDLISATNTVITITYFGAEGSPNGTLEASPGTIVLARDGSVHVKTMNSDTYGWEQIQTEEPSVVDDYEPATVPPAVIPVPVTIVNAIPPTISGQAWVGSQILGDAGVWTDADELVYQWQTSPGATWPYDWSQAAGTTDEINYTPVQADHSCYVRLQVTGETTGSDSVVATSDPTELVGWDFSGDWRLTTGNGTNVSVSTCRDYQSLFLVETPSRVQFVTDPTHSGSSKVAFVVTHQNDVDHDGLVERTEYTDVGTLWGPGNDFWVGWRVRFATGYSFGGSANYNIFGQHFGETGGTTTGTPPFSVDTGDDAVRFLVDVRGGAKALNTDVAPSERGYFMAASIPLDTWIHLKFHFFLSTGSDGFVHGWQRSEGGSWPVLANFTDSGVNVLTVGGIVQNVYPEYGMYRHTRAVSQGYYDGGRWFRKSEAEINALLDAF